MRFHVLTLFPELIETILQSSITGRAMAKGVISLRCVNIRDYAPPERKSRVDDYPFGGGAGMVIQPEPVYAAWRAVMDKYEMPSGCETEDFGCDDRQKAGADDTADFGCNEREDAGCNDRAEIGRNDRADSPQIREARIEQEKPGKKQGIRTIYLTPQGKVFNQQMAIELAQEESLCFLCGHYEGIDERVLEEIVTDEISIGDYVLTGGELPACVVMDAIARMVPGVLSNAHSGEDESFMNSLLEYPQYTRPAVWHEKEVPPILLSGHHANVEKWRKEQSIKRTFERRPELLERADLNVKEKIYLEQLKNGRPDPV